MLLFPLPNALQEVLTSEIMAGLALIFEDFLLHDGLSRNSSMICTRNIQCFETGHPLPPYERVFDGRGKCMADMQVARNVGRRQTDHKLLRICGLVVSVVELSKHKLGCTLLARSHSNTFLPSWGCS